jgi:CRISPR-associated protein Cas2
LLVVYDVKEERVNKVHAFLKTYLHWIQNSVFEGHVTKAQLEQIKSGLKKIVDLEYDAIYFFKVRNPKHIQKEIMGIEIGDTSFII